MPRAARCNAAWQTLQPQRAASPARRVVRATSTILAADLRPMTCRVFTDPSGREWNVWAVLPSLFADVRSSHRAWVAQELESGWLAFEMTPDASEKRRLAPVPTDWELSSDAMLLELWARATPVRARRDPGSAR